jgi:uncharacterized protein (TIGR03435 family)
MKNRIALRLAFVKKAFLAGAGFAALATPIAVGMLNAPTVRAQSAVAAWPKFEVASIRPCGNGDFGPVGRGGSKGGGGSFAPGRLTLNCQSVLGLISAAYIINANGRMNLAAAVKIPIEGGPNWISSERYTINAEAEGAPTRAMMAGPMLQSLLEERLKLKVHRATREVPVYALNVAKGGPKLNPFKEGSCISVDLTSFSQAPLAPGEKRCRSLGAISGPMWTVDAEGITIEGFLDFLVFPTVDRPIIDKTGISGRFNFHLAYANPTLGGDPAAPSDPVGPSIFTAVQEQLGLKLEPTKGPGEFLIIDHVERPSEN